MNRGSFWSLCAEHSCHGASLAFAECGLVLSAFERDWTVPSVTLVQLKKKKNHFTWVLARILCLTRTLLQNIFSSQHFIPGTLKIHLPSLVLSCGANCWGAGGSWVGVRQNCGSFVVQGVHKRTIPKIPLTSSSLIPDYLHTRDSSPLGNR